jgi:DNA-binding MarR family transcriptional regulator
LKRFFVLASSTTQVDTLLIHCIIHIMNNTPGVVSSADARGATGGEAGTLGLLDVAYALQERVETALEVVGLSVPKYLALQRLVEAVQPVSLSALADRQRCVRSNITQLIDRLETDGLVKRVSDPTDRRAVRATVTALGKERFDAARAAVNQVQGDLASRLAPEDREAFVRILAAIRSA